jgi:hypothetical protein
LGIEIPGGLIGQNYFGLIELGSSDGYALLFSAAVISLPASYREMLGLKRPPSIVIPLTRFMLVAIRWMIGPESPIEQAALDRLARLKL